MYLYTRIHVLIYTLFFFYLQSSRLLSDLIVWRVQFIYFLYRRTTTMYRETTLSTRTLVLPNCRVSRHSQKRSINKILKYFFSDDITCRYAHVIFSYLYKYFLNGRKLDVTNNRLSSKE